MSECTTCRRRETLWMKDVSNAERLKLLEHNAHLPIYEHRDIVVRAGRQNAESVLSLKRKKGSRND